MKILCYGDSNTYGYDPRSYFGDRYAKEDRWVDILAQKLGCQTINEGENGRQIPGREGEILRFRRLPEQYGAVDLVILMLGTNDLLQGKGAERTARDMEAFLAHPATLDHRILLVAPPALCRGEWVSGEDLIRESVALSGVYEALARRMGVDFADAGQWKIPLAFDGVHFTEAGHRRFAEALADHLNKGETLCWKQE